MNRRRMTILYSGRVQGVGFRFTVKSLAMGCEVTGIIRNLGDGRVELIAEGQTEELEVFRQLVRDSGLGPLVRQEEVAWGDAAGGFSGFAIMG